MTYWEDCYLRQQDAYIHDDDGWLSRHGARLPKGGHALDLGCGSGVNTGVLLRRGMRVTAADLSREAAAITARCFPGAHTLAMDMTRPFPFADSIFDAVVADLSLHYFSWADTQRIIAEIARVLRPGGALLARVHALSNVDPAGLEQIEEHYYVSSGYPRRYFTEDELRTLFAHWAQLDAGEKSITRYGMHKRVFELLAIANEA